MNKEIRDRHGKLVGTLYIRQYYHELRDRNGAYVGTYDILADQTRDRHGVLVGSGNSLITLLHF